MLYAFALPKKEDGFARLINHLLSINAYIQSPENKFKASLILVTCESRKRMTNAYAAIRAFEELDELDLMFVLDKDTSEGNALENVYICEYNRENKGVTYYKTDVSLFSAPQNIENGDSVSSN